MTVRFCATCHTEVEEREGFCLLGHPLRLDAPVASLKELRAEVDRAFEDAREQIATVVAVESPGQEPLFGAAVVPSNPTAGPPPPPPASSGVTRFEAVWKALEDASPTGKDPIEAFAPAPRMDWGPEGALRKKMRRSRRSRPQLV